MSSAAVLVHKTERRLGPGARRAHGLLLNEGGWWSMREMCWALEVNGATLLPQIAVLLGRQHIARRGAGKAGEPFEYAVLVSCVPVPGVFLQQAAV